MRYIYICFLLFALLVGASAGELTFWGPGYLGDARATALAPNGEIWVGTSSKLAVFSADGVFLRATNSAGQVNSITFTSKGTPIVGYNDGFFQVMSAKPFNVPGFRQYTPWEVTVDEKDNVYATDGGNGVIKKFDISGTLPVLLTTYKAPEEAAMERPFSVALDAQGMLYVSDESKPGLWVFKNDGTFVERLLADQQCFRVRFAEGQLYVVTTAGVTVLKPGGEVVRQIGVPGGFHKCCGFAIGKDGTLYCGDFYDGVVRKYSADGKLLQVMGPSYKATLQTPEAWEPGVAVTLPLHITPLASNPLGKVPPTFSLTLQPAFFYGEPDSNFANLQGMSPSPEWIAKRMALYQAQEIALPVQQNADSLQVRLPDTVGLNLYQLLVHSEHDAPGGITDQKQAVRVSKPGAAGSFTLFIPRSRSVFQQGERVELNAIFRTKAAFPAGALAFTLAPRQGDSLAFQPGMLAWKNFPLAATASRTHTYSIDTRGMYPGRYLLQAEFIGGGETYRDTWPLTVVGTLAATRFQILFPEWSAGYTDIWGPYTGQGMRADATILANEGITLYDTTIGSRNQDPNLRPIGFEADISPALQALAAADPALPAPERFQAANPLEIELQEALRNKLAVQRDIWGSHFLSNWGMADPLGMARDNRDVQMWTQWQREWPSWIGHRYLTLSIDEGENPERMAIVNQLKQQGIIVPSEQELIWARNGMQRRFISDAPAPATEEYSGIGSDAAGNVYLASRGGTLVQYGPDGKQRRLTRIPGEVIDIAVAADGTVYAAHLGKTVSVTAPDGTERHFSTPGFSTHSPRGIAIEPDGNLLVADEDNGLVVRFSPAGKQLTVFADQKNLQRPAGIGVFKDGTVAVLDGGRGGTMLFKADGTPLDFLQGVGSHSAGGKGDVTVAADDTLWVTQGWGMVQHYDRTGKWLSNIGRNSFAPGAMSLPMSIAITAEGNVLVSDVALPFAQEFNIAGEPVRLYGMNSLLADVRIDRQRYTWADRIVTTVWNPVAGQEGDPKATLWAFARQGDAAPWQPLISTPYGGGDFAVAAPRLTGTVTLRLVWAPAGATAEHPLHADFSIDVQSMTPPAEAQRLADILQRELTWKTKWARTRMGTLTRWTQLSTHIRPGVQCTAPTNYGTPDTLAEGVWVPWRRDAVVAECENTGHDHGDFPLQGPWYVARALEGPQAKPAWCSLLQWYWNDPDTRQRPLRDTILLLGTGASGIGVGTSVTRMSDDQLALHRTIVDELQRLGDATMGLDLPGAGGVAVLHSFTQEAMDPYMEEHFYTAHAAWYDLLRAHIPTAVVSEETIAQGGLSRFKAVLLTGIQHPLSTETMTGLEKYRLAGGEIWVDLATRITIPGAKVMNTRYRAFWAQDAYYWMHNGYGVGGYDGNYEYWRMKQGSDQRLPAVKKAFGRFAILPVTTDDPNIFLMQRRGGLANYIFAGNDHFPDQPLYKTHLASQTPVPADVTFQLTGAAVYDALAMTRVTETTLPVNFTNDQPGRIWVVLPQPINSVKLAVTPAVGGDRLTINVQLLDVTNKVIAAVIPLELTVRDSAGNEQAHLWRSTNASGLFTFDLPLGWGAPAGKWSVTARELLSRKEATPATAAVAARPTPSITAVDTPALVFDTPAISAWITAQQGKEVWIALDTAQAPLRPQADALVQGLTKRGVKARVIDIAQLPEKPLALSYNMSPDDQQTLDAMRSGQSIGTRVSNAEFKVPGPQRIIMRPLILLGQPAENRWLNDIQQFQLTRRQLSPSYPGPGRALLQYVWAPFYDGYDAITICANDADGVQKGIEALLAF